MLLKRGDHMADLTLDEFRGIPENELRQILREEARKIFGEQNDLFQEIKSKKGKAGYPVEERRIPVMDFKDFGEGH